MLNPEKVEGYMRALATYLGISDVEDEELSRRQQRKVPGSCEWLLEKEDFRLWRDKDDSLNDNRHQIYWLNGDPGCGKSFLAGHVVTHLREIKRDSSFYFLKHGDIGKQGIGGLLKSIAYQMARNSASLRRSLLSMQKEDTLIAEPTDLRAIWKQLFVQRVFRVDLERHQYWIIDALDEARGKVELFGLLQSLPRGYSVFITSRNDPDLKREFRKLDMKVIAHQIEQEDTLQDIRTYLEHNEEDLHVDDSSQLQMLIQKLVDKSKGSFLWTNLILQELADYWTDDDIEDVLNNVPEGMQHLYTRILSKISQNVNGALAKAILRWVICAIRPMLVAELRTAIRLDTSRTLKRSAQAIESICQPLVRVNNNRVEIVHDTVRDYLFNKDDRRSQSDDISGFLFDRGSSHEQLSIICLTFLGRSLRSPLRKMSHETSIDADDESFLDYASKNVFDHVVKSGSADESAHTHRMIGALLEFFQGPLLFWIQRQAQDRSLSTLTRAGKNLKAYVTKRTLVPTHLHSQLQELQEWAEDLIHLVTTFGKDLLKEPGVIHSVIPSLCPSRSMIYSELRNPEIGLQVVGLSQGSWPDQISCSSFGHDYANALACCEKSYAVALRSKQIVLYYSSTCQEARRITTIEPIKRMEFAHGKDWLIASGRKTLTMYNYETTDEIWSTPTTHEIVALSIDAENSHLITVTREKDVETFSVKNGERLDCRHLHLSRTQGQMPRQVHISDEMNLLALIHRHEPLELYDLQSLQPPKGQISYYANIETIAFNQALNMLAMSSFDGELCNVDLFSMRKMQRTEVDVSHMAASWDGKTLIVGTKSGDLQIHDFESLQLLHIIRHYEEEFMGLCFTSNSLRFLDIRRQFFNVWEPAALFRRIDDDETSNSDGLTTFSTAPSEFIQSLMNSDQSPISAIVEHHSGDFIFCAKENGTVAVYETSHARPKQKLFDCGRTQVLYMAWNRPRNLLASADNSSTVKLHHIRLIQERHVAGTRHSWHVKEVLKKTFQQPVRQILLSLDGDFLLISTTTKEYMFSTSGGAPLFSHDSSLGPTSLDQSQKWTTYVKKRHQFLEIQKEGGQTISWEKDGSKPRVDPIQASDLVHNEPVLAQANAHLVRIDTQLWAAYDNNPHTAPLVWAQPTALLSEGASAKMAAHALLSFGNIAPQVDGFLGIHAAKLVFVSTDSWICSVRIDKARLEDPVKYHFPMPHYWRSASRRRMGLLTCRGDIVLAIGGDLVIVKQCLG